MSVNLAQGASPGPVRRVVIRLGLLYGAIIAALDAVAAVAAWLSLSPSSAFPGVTGGADYRLTIVVVGIGTALVGLATLILPIFLGMAVYKRVRQVGAGALAGLVAGGMGGVIGGLATLALAILAQMTPASSIYGSGSMPLWVTGASIVSGLAWQCGLGAGLGAVGALIRQSVFT